VTERHLDAKRFPFESSQARLSASAEEELGEPLELAVIATGQLADALWQTELPAPDAQPPGAAYDRRAAVYGLAVLGVRTARALILLVVNGWEPEAHALKRRLTEAAFRVRDVLADHSGEAARQWLDGRASSTGALFQKYGAKGSWSAFSSGSHADARSLQLVMNPPPWIAAPANQPAVSVMPERDLWHAQGLLLDCAGDAGLLLAGLAVVIGGSIAFDSAYMERMKAAHEEFAAQSPAQGHPPTRGSIRLTSDRNLLGQRRGVASPRMPAEPGDQASPGRDPLAGVDVVQRLRGRVVPAVEEVVEPRSQVGERLVVEAPWQRVDPAFVERL
jgi:hypothetical protein